MGNRPVFSIHASHDSFQQIPMGKWWHFRDMKRNMFGTFIAIALGDVTLSPDFSIRGGRGQSRFIHAQSFLQKHSFHQTEPLKKKRHPKKEKCQLPTIDFQQLCYFHRRYSRPTVPSTWVYPGGVNYLVCWAQGEGRRSIRHRDKVVIRILCFFFAEKKWMDGSGRIMAKYLKTTRPKSQMLVNNM